MVIGVQNFLRFLSEHWVAIVIDVCIAVFFVKRVIAFLRTTKEEKIDIAKTQIRSIVLKLVADAEEDYAEWNKSGSIKRAQVIQQIFDSYPVLERVVNQQEIIHWIDGVINDALNEMRQSVAENE